jgi:hypothetical protein
MKKIIALVLIILGYTMINSQSSPTPADATFNGSAMLSNQTFKTLTIRGSGMLDHITANTIDVKGSAIVSNSIVETAQISGSCDARHCTITNVTIKGSGNLLHCTFDQLNAFGSINLMNSTVNNKTIIHGKPTITDSTIHDLTANGHDIQCTSSKILGSVLIEKSTQSDFLWSFASWINSFFSSSPTKKLKQQILTLTDTIVHGDITFEQEGGLVILKGNSKIMGKVVNGAVVQK